MRSTTQAVTLAVVLFVFAVAARAQTAPDEMPDGAMQADEEVIVGPDGSVNVGPAEPTTEPLPRTFPPSELPVAPPPEPVKRPIGPELPPPTMGAAMGGGCNPNPLAGIPPVDIPEVCAHPPVETFIEECIYSVNDKLDNLADKLAAWDKTKATATAVAAKELATEIVSLATDARGHLLGCLSDTAWSHFPIPNDLKSAIENSSAAAEHVQKAFSGEGDLKTAKGLYDSTVSAAKSVISAAGNIATWVKEFDWRSEERQSTDALAEARRQLGDCDILETERSLQTAERIGAQALRAARLETGRLRRCLINSEEKIAIHHPRLSGVNPYQQRERDYYAREYSRAKASSDSLTAHLRAVGEACVALQTTAKRKPEMDNTYRRVLDQARAAIKACKLDAARESLASLKKMEGHACLRHRRDSEKLAGEIKAAHCGAPPATAKGPVRYQGEGTATDDLQTSCVTDEGPKSEHKACEAKITVEIVLVKGGQLDALIGYHGYAANGFRGEVYCRETSGNPVRYRGSHDGKGGFTIDRTLRGEKIEPIVGHYDGMHISGRQKPHKTETAVDTPLCGNGKLIHTKYLSFDIPFRK
jgi:hypothetical protein